MYQIGTITHLIFPSRLSVSLLLSNENPSYSHIFRGFYRLNFRNIMHSSICTTLFLSVFLFSKFRRFSPGTFRQLSRGSILPSSRLIIRRKCCWKMRYLIFELSILTRGELSLWWWDSFEISGTSVLWEIKIS